MWPSQRQTGSALICAYFVYFFAPRFYSMVSKKAVPILRFGRRKSLAGRRTHAFVDEALEAPAVEVFTDVDVSFAVDREGMRHVQRTAEDTLLADVVDDLERLTLENPDVVVGAIDYVQEALIGRERQPGRRSSEQRSRRDESF